MRDKQVKTNFIIRFIDAIERLLKMPVLEDPSLQRKAEIIHILSSLGLISGFATLTITPFVFDNTLRGMSITGCVLMLLFLIQILNRKGYVKFAAGLFVGSVWVFDAVMVIFSGGFNSQFLPTFIAITVMGGLLMGEMYTFYLASASTISYLLLYFIDSRGLTPAVLFEFTPIAVILINVITLFQAGTVLIMVLLRYERTFNRLIAKEEDLESSNLELSHVITALEAAESHLRLSENRLKSALMEFPYPTMLHAQNGEILLVNSAWINECGYSQEKLLDYEGWLDHMFRENSSQVTNILEELLVGDVRKNEGFYDIYKENGKTLKWYMHWTRLPALVDGRNLFLTVAMDLTGLMNVETALRERDEMLSKFSLVSNDGLWDWNLQTDKVAFDPLYYTMAGYEVDEFPHELEEFRKRVHPDDVENVFTQAEDYLKGVNDKFAVEFRFLQKDGDWLWVMGRGKITEQDENGNPLRFVGTHTDISTQKIVEEELSDYQLQLEDIVDFRTQELNERIIEVERLNAALTNILDDYQAANEKLSVLGNNLTAANQELESLTYSLSTDLLHPILNIKKTANKLLKNKSKDLDEKDQRAIQLIQENAIRVNQQIENLLQISQLSQKELQLDVIEPVKLVKKILKSYSKQTKENRVNLVIKDLPMCLADRDLLEQVFDNIISNAIKYTAGQKNPEIQIGYQPDQDTNRVIYYIQDNGIGFNPETKHVVLGSIQQEDKPEKRQGRGIGLTLAKLIVNKHNGKIWAESEEGEGATFYFDLATPADDDE